MKELAVIFAEGFEEIEALTPVDFCRRAGIQVDTVSLDQKLEVSSSHGILIKADKSLNQVDIKVFIFLEVYQQPKSLVKRKKFFKLFSILKKRIGFYFLFVLDQ